MRIQDYCKVTERVKPDPSLKEAIMKRAAQLPGKTGGKTNTQQKPKIRRHINGKAAAGAGIAAALVAGNIVLFGNLLNSRNDPKQPGTSDIQEVGLNTAHYAQCMQDYYSSQTGEPCTYDFTGMGQDLDYVWDSEDYRITLHAAAGDAFQMHLFYDVIPLKGQKYEDAVTYSDWIERMQNQDWPCVNARYTRYDGEYDPDSAYDMAHRKPLFGGSGVDPGTAYAVTNDGENGGEVWHMHCVLYEETGAGFCPTGFYVQVDEREKDVENSWIGSGGTNTQDAETNELYYLNFDFIQAPEWHDACFPPETGLSEYTLIAVTPLTVMLKDDYADNFPYTTWQLEAGQHTGDEAASEDMAHLDEMQADCSMQTAVGEITEQPLDTPTRFAVNLYSDKSVSASTWYYPLSKPVVPEQCFSVTLNSTVIPLTTADVKDPQTAEAVTESTENAGNYAALMKDYFGVDLDYSGLGQDCGLKWSTDDAEFTLKAIGGDHYHLYYFFDAVIPAEASSFDYSISLLPVWRNNILGVEKEEQNVELTGQDKTEDGRQICHYVSSVNYAQGGQFFAQEYNGYALRALPMQMNPDDGQMMPAGEAQMLTADFLNSSVPGTFLAPDTVIPYNGRDYDAVYVSPFGLRLTDVPPGEGVNYGCNDSGCDLPLTSINGQNEFYVGYTTDNASASEFQTAAVRTVYELTFSDGNGKDVSVVDVEFREPVDLRQSVRLNIAGTVMGGYDVQISKANEEAAHEAVVVMSEFLTACCDEKRDEMRRLSLIEKVVRGYLSADASDAEVEREVSDYLDDYSMIISYRLSAPTDITAEWDEIRQTEKDITELYTYMFREQGYSDEEIAANLPNDCSDFYAHIDRVYGFTVTMRVKNGNGEVEEKTEDMAAVRYGGKWFADPPAGEILVPSLSDEGREKLAEYRAKDTQTNDTQAKATQSDSE